MSDARPAFSPAAEAVIAVLRPHTPFAEAIVRRQAERVGLSLESVGQFDLAKLVPMVIAASHTFVDPGVVAELKRLA